MKINNLIGQNIYTETIFKSETMIDLSSFEKGIYIVELRNKNKTFTEKVIIK